MSLIHFLLSGDESETWSEEILNSGTHLLGLILSIVGTYLLTIMAIIHRKSWHHVVSCITFSVALLIVYICSTLYHSIGIFHHSNMPLREQYKQIDHLAIYFLIAGTYTPVALVGILSSKTEEARSARKYAYALLVIEWVCAIAGVSTKLLLGVDAVPSYVSNCFYLAMGWAVVIGAKPIAKCVPSLVMFWLALGGLSYSIGVAWLIFDSLHFNHAIWHLHVMIGSLCHFVCILLLQIPLPEAAREVKSMWAMLKSQHSRPAALPIIVDFFRNTWFRAKVMAADIKQHIM